jgi:GT2 family glycosyltransferase/ubiquinone/menaquinone biosynthesis C-methylase UbiE
MKNDELERFVPELRGRISYEHRHRYAMCLDFVSGKTVLDAACGEGYGSEMLARMAKRVTGVDLDQQVIAQAKKKYLKTDRIEFAVTTCSSLPFKDGAFDVVISFETIEHFTEQTAFIGEVNRVLNAGGTLIMSTPNRPVYSDETAQRNPFHEKELDEPELRMLLGQYFKYVRLLGQRFYVPSVIGPLSKVKRGSKASYESFVVRDCAGAAAPGPVQVAHPQYLIAVCSNAPIRRFPASSIFVDETDDLWREQERILGWASGLHDEDEQLRGRLRDSDARVGQLRDEIREARTTVRSFEEELNKSHQDQMRAASDAERLSRALQTKADDLEGARATVRSLEEELNKSRQDQMRAASDTERLSRALQTKADDLEREREANVQLQQQLKQANSLIESQTSTLRDGEEALKEHNTQFLLLVLKQRVLREVAAAGRAVSPKIGQMPLGLAFSHGQLRPTLSSPAVPRRKRRSEWDAVAQSGLFDSEWYLAHNPDVANAGVPAFDHFMIHGIAEYRDPGPLFSSGWYSIQMQRHDLSLELPPLLHYLSIGRVRHLSPHPLFDPRYYLASYKDIAESGIDPLQHFLMHGAAEWRNPHPLVWMQRLAEQPELPAGSSNVLVAYLARPQSFAASPHPLFDGRDYLAKNPDVARAGVNPLLHYCTMGWRQARTPHGLFAGDWYLARNPDVLAADVNPLEHYVRHGAREYRDPHPLFDIKFYYSRHPEARRLPYDALSDYVANGLGNHPRETTSKISVADIRTLVPPDVLERAALISAFLDFDFAVTKTASSRGDFETEAAAAWPPKPSRTYWLPQRLREYVLDRHGDEAIGLYTYLMAVVEQHDGQQSGFSQTRDFAVLRDRLRLLVSKRGEVGKCDVSIIVPVFNNLVYTLTSLISLLEQDSKRSYEVLIGDDGSTDGTPEVFATAGGCVRLIRHEENLGFLRNCNRTASFAKGQTIVLLNNDTLVLPGWLDALIDVLETTPNAGLVGSKLINADGTLQEAGGIFWRDGSAWNFGRNCDACAPEFNYFKDVDYVSGASMALSADLWRRLGGLDPEFTPAYCEDADLAFRIRGVGLRTIYAPQSELIHHEGKSHGRDPGSGVKAYQAVNQGKFFARWQHELEARHFANGESVFLARDRSRGKPRILVVDHYPPQPDRDAGSRTIYEWLKLIAGAGFHVTFWPHNLYLDRIYTPMLQRLGIETLYGWDGIWPEFAAWLEENGKHLDYALLSRPEVAIDFLDQLKAAAPKAKILFYGHDIQFQRLQLELAVNDTPQIREEIAAREKIERQVWAKCDVIYYLSAEERDFVKSQLPHTAVEVIPSITVSDDHINSMRRRLATHGVPATKQLLFVAGFRHRPNVDAMLWFAETIWPQIASQVADARLVIAGSHPPREIEALAGENVQVTGAISARDLHDTYLRTNVAVVPLRFGAGVKTKVLEALSYGTPIVTTSIGAQGLTQACAAIDVCDEPDAFAAAVIRILQRPEAAQERCLQGLDFIESAFSPEALRRVFARSMPELRERERTR